MKISNYQKGALRQGLERIYMARGEQKKLNALYSGAAGCAQLIIPGNSDNAVLEEDIKREFLKAAQEVGIDVNTATRYIRGAIWKGLNNPREYVFTR